MPPVALNTLQRRIVGALQIDGRASWRWIAEVFGEPERTVARYGADLIDSGKVVVAATEHAECQIILACTSVVGGARLSSESLAQRSDVTFCYLTTGTRNVVAEVGYSGDLSALLIEQLPATAGLSQIIGFPVLRYFKTVRGWRVGALTEAEEAALTSPDTIDRTERQPAEFHGPRDDEIIRALRADGRVSIEELARHTRMSESSVRRRIGWLVSSGQFSIRALVDPAEVGLRVEALLWVRAPSYEIESLGRKLRRWIEVRYAVALAGDWQLLVDVTVSTHVELYSLLARSIWAEHATQVRTDFVIAARKRGGRMQ